MITKEDINFLFSLKGEDRRSYFNSLKKTYSYAIYKFGRGVYRLEKMILKHIKNSLGGLK